MDIGGWIVQCSNHNCSSGSPGFIARMTATQQRFGGLRTRWRGTYATQSQAGVGNGAILVQHYNGSDTCQGVVTFTARKLHKRTPSSRKQTRNPQFGQQFTRFEVGREIAFEEILGRDGTTAGAATNLKLCIQGEHHGWQFGGWISVGNAATNGAAVADGRISNTMSGVYSNPQARPPPALALPPRTPRPHPHRPTTLP